MSVLLESHRQSGGVSKCSVPSSYVALIAAIQVAMGWTDSHLHSFEKDGKHSGIHEYDDLIDENKTQLVKLLRAEGDSVIYVYDFGDYWRHEIVLEKILAAKNDSKHPVCLGGERRCPPEDVGGVSGYEEFLEVIFDPTHEEYEHYVGWVGGHFIDVFDLGSVNQKLSGMRWPVRHRR